jgi:molybdenum cofactor synthesis domain-containing protein
MTAGILIVSDRCASGKMEERTGPAIRKVLEEKGWTVGEYAVVPDERDEIGKTLKDWADVKGLHLVLTAGGTGLGPRDVTPEATRAVIEKEADGLVHLMRAEGLKHTARAALSRGVAGTRKNTLIVNLPGSPRGAEESLRAILDVVPHAVAMMRGEGHE